MEKSRIYFRDRESRRGCLNGTCERERIATTRWKIYVFSRGGIGWILLNLLELNAVRHLRKGKLEGRFIPQLFRPACAAIIYSRVSSIRSRLTSYASYLYVRLYITILCKE